MGYNLKKFFRSFGGLNLADSELLKDDTIATDLINSKFGDNLSKIKRRGFKRDQLGVGGNGCISYINRRLSGQSDSIERLIVTDRLYRLLEQEFTINYSGAKSTAISMEIIAGQFNFIIKEDGDAVLTVPLGSLKETVSAVTLSDLNATINALPDYTSTIDADVFANILPALENQSFEGSIIVPYTIYEEIPFSGNVAPFADHWALRDTETFELTDHIQARGVLYFTDAQSGLWKYDGGKLQKASSFKADPITADPGPSGASYLYRVVYKFVDDQGNTTYSIPSDALQASGLSTLNLNPLDPVTSPYNLDNATQVILRTVDEGAGFFVVEEIPVTDSTYVDTVPDTDLVEAYALPQFTQPNPGKYAYIDMFRDQIVLNGNPENLDEVAFEDLLLTDNFFALGTFNTESRDGGTNSGIKSLDNVLFCFKANSVFAVTGVLDTGEFQVDTLSDEGIGCLSNKSLIEFNRRVWFLGNKGIYSVGPQDLRMESRDISPLFQKELRKVTTLRSFSLNWVEEDVLLINLPERVNGNRFSSDSRTLAYHSKTGNWSVWKNLNFANGADNFDFKIFFASDHIANNGDIATEINTSLHTNSRLDYADNQEAIYWLYGSNWESYGEPSVPKKYVRLKLYSLDTPLQNFDETAFTIDIVTQHEFEYNTVSSTSLDFNDDSGGWGVDPWGVFPWGHVRNRTRRTRLSPKKTRAIRTVLSNNNLYENVLLTGYEFEVAVDYDTYMRKG